MQQELNKQLREKSSEIYSLVVKMPESLFYL